MRFDLKRFIVCLAVPLAVGGLASLAAGGYGLYAELDRPALSPPGWVFPIVWTALYILLGAASCRVVTAPASREASGTALTVYACALALNFFWPVPQLVEKGLRPFPTKGNVRESGPKLEFWTAFPAALLRARPAAARLQNIR